MKHELDFSGREQLYYQIYDYMFQQIVNGVYQIGDLIPAESELVSYYNVSRATVRKAMELLANDGFIEKRRGHGTYVIDNRVKNDPTSVIAYSRDNIFDKKAAYKAVVSHTIVDAADEKVELLEVKPGTPLMRLERVRYAGEDPMYIEVNYLEHALMPEAMERDFSKESLRIYYATYCNIIWANANEKIYAVAADERTSKLLNISVGDPLILINRISYDQAGVPREYTETTFRADIYHLSISLTT